MLNQNSILWQSTFAAELPYFLCFCALIWCTEFNVNYYFFSLSCLFSKINTWGYSTINFFAPMNRYASRGGGPRNASREFKEMVKALHGAGIEVINCYLVINLRPHSSKLGAMISFLFWYGKSVMYAHQHTCTRSLSSYWSNFLKLFTVSRLFWM